MRKQNLVVRAVVLACGFSCLFLFFVCLSGCGDLAVVWDPQTDVPSGGASKEAVFTLSTDWKKKLKGWIFASQTDADGNTYVAMRFRGDITVAGKKSDLLDSSDYGSYLAKIGPDGQIMWVKFLGSMIEVIDLKFLPDGNLVACGEYSFYKEVNFGNGFVLKLEGDTDGFVLKVDAASGRTIWVVKHGGKYEHDSSDGVQTFGDFSFSLSADKSGIYLAGFCQGEQRFGAMPITCSASRSETFIARLSHDGRWQWVKVFTYIGSNIALTGNSIFLVSTSGAYAGSKFSHLNPNHFEFLLRIRKSDGKLEWHQPFGSINGKGRYSAVVLRVADGGLYLAAGIHGEIGAECSEKGQCRISLKVANEGFRDSIVARVSFEGRWQWVRQIKGLGNGEATTSKGIRIEDVLVLKDRILLVGSIRGGGASFGRLKVEFPPKEDHLFVARLNKTTRRWDWAINRHLPDSTYNLPGSWTIARDSLGFMYVGSYLGIRETGDSPFPGLYSSELWKFTDE